MQTWEEYDFSVLKKLMFLMIKNMLNERQSFDINQAVPWQYFKTLLFIKYYCYQKWLYSAIILN